MVYIVYQINNKLNGMLYVGVHSTKNINDSYMGSGGYIKRAIKKYGMTNFEKIVLHQFNSKEEALNKEAEIVNEEFIKRKDTYNIALGGLTPITVGSAVVRDSEGNCLRVDMNDARIKSGEFWSISKGLFKGTIPVIDKNGKFFRVLVNDVRYLSKEVVHINKNKVLVTNKTGKFFMVTKQDPRFISGEFVAIFKNRSHSKTTKEKIGAINRIKQKGNLNSQFGTCWIYNQKIKKNKKINIIELKSYEDKGWLKGRKMNLS